MTKQKEYFDVNVVNETRNETYKRLAALAEESTGIEKDKVYEMLVISDKPGKDGGLNGGNKVTNDVKFLVKASFASGATLGWANVG